MLGAAWKRWNWLDDGLIPLAAMLMYAAWSYPLLALFLQDPSTGSPHSGFTFWFCLGVLLGGVISGRLAHQNRMGVVIVLAGGLAAVLISLFLTLPSEIEDLDLGFIEMLGQATRGSRGEVVPAPLIAAIGTTILWWRGLRIASQTEHEEAMGTFVVGVIALGGLLVVILLLPSGTSLRDSELGQAWRQVIPCLSPALFFVSILAAVLSFVSRAGEGWSATFVQLVIVSGLLSFASVLPLGTSPEALTGWALLFLISGLMTLSLTGISRTLREQERLTGMRVRIDRYWIVTILAIVVGTLLFGLLVGQLLAPNALIRVLGWFKPIWTLLVQILLLIILVFAYLFFGLLEPLLAEADGRTWRLPTFGSPLDPVAMEELATREAIQIPPIFNRILQVLLILGLVALVAFIFFAAIRRRKEKVQVEDTEIVETRETILSTDLLRGQLFDLFDSLRRKRPPPLFLEPGLAGDPRRVVRELYQRVLAQAIELDLPRRRGQTPNAYQHTLNRICSEERSSLETLTLVYMVARYGVVPPTHEQVLAAQDAFARIDAALQAKMKRPDY
jgi:hypothetical protein